MNRPVSSLPASAPGIDKNACFHCGLPLNGSDLTITLDDKQEGVCCGGCQAVANAILDSGNADYYRFRDRNAETGSELVPEFLSKIKVYDHPSVQRQLTAAASAASHRVLVHGRQRRRNPLRSRNSARPLERAGAGAGIADDA